MKPIFKYFFFKEIYFLCFCGQVILFLVLLIAPACLLGQGFTPDPDWRFENFNSQSHFISNGINNIVVDKKGYIWTASTGIQRFDGYKTLNFNSFEQNNQGLKNNSTDIAIDDSGKTWINAGGLCYYDDAKAKFIYVDPDPNRTIGGMDYMTFKGNDLWYAGDYGLTKIDVKSQKMFYTSLRKVGNALGNFFIGDDTILVSSREKVFFYNIKNNTYTTRTFVYKNSLLKIFTAVQSGGTIYLGTNKGLFTLSRNLQTIAPLGIVTGDLIDDLLFMPQDKEKKYLFVATDGSGILVYNTITKKLAFTYVHDDNNPYSLPNNVISKLFADKQGRLWMATGSGIAMLDLDNQHWKMRWLYKANISKIACDKYDSTRVWMSSFTQGMICINWTTKQVERTFNTNPLMHDICDFVQLSKNKWLLAGPRKLMEWDMQSGALFERKMPVSDSVNLIYNISNLIMAENNACYITTTYGLFRYDIVTHDIKPISTNDSKKKNSDALQYILLSGFYDNGTIWAASRNGLFSYMPATNKTVVYRGKGPAADYYFFDINKAPSDRIVCASSTGLAIFEKKTGRFTTVRSIANLQSPLCVSTLSIKNRVWMGSEAGILTYDLETRKSETAEQESSLMQLSPGSPFYIINSSIVRGYPGGYVYFTAAPKNTLVPTDPVIEQIYVNNQPAAFYKGSQIQSNKTTFSYKQNSINIAFTAFLYTDPASIKFRYRLKGADPAWQYPEDQRTANFAQLEPGDYTFYVQSGNKNGIWNKNQASFSFIIKPPYWATWWFRTLAILLITFILYRMYQYRIKNILAIQLIREKIASDFHDDIGSALSSISIFSDVANKQLQQELPREKTREIIDRISYHSRDMLDAMDDIVWAVNPKNDSFKNLTVRMNEFAIPLLEAKNIQFEINIQPDILNSRIKMETRKNLFLVFKECINNSVKHSGCSLMKVMLQRSNNQLELTISDNGKGFELNAPSGRNGLKNIQKRAAEIGGILKIDTGTGHGTTTTLLVNII